MSQSGTQPTIGDVYNPLIEAARRSDPHGHTLLRATGQAILESNPDKCSGIEDGIRAAKQNLDYYCQYFDAEMAGQVKRFYQLGEGFRDLAGNKHGFS